MEKFQTFRRGKTLIFSAFFLALITFNSCKEEMQFTEVAENEPTSLKVKAAMQWFEEQKKIAPAKATHLKTMEPVWAKAIVIGKIVEVPYKVDGKFYFPGLTKQPKNLGRQKLVIENNGVKGFRSYIVSYIPTENFRGKIQNINMLNFRHLQFDGMVRIFSINKNPTKILYFQKGKQASSLSSLSLNTRGDCWTTEWDVWTTNGEWFAGEIYVEVDCNNDNDDDEEEDEDDPCANSNPPSYCTDGDDPCATSNPPAYCLGNGDPCMSASPPPTCDVGPADDPDPDPDPCEGPNPPENCPCKQKKKGYNQWIGTQSYSPFGWVEFFLTTQNVDVNSATLSNDNMQPVEKKIHHSHRVVGGINIPGIPAIYSFSDEGFEKEDDIKHGCKRIIFLRNYGITTVQQEEKGFSLDWSFPSNWTFE